MNTYLFAQAATPAATTTTQAAPTTDAAPKAPQQQNGFGMFVPMLIIFALFVGGVILNILDSKCNTVYHAWIVHIFANLAINTIGMILFGIL